ncbi:hypothetical protein C8J57DRAFT_566948 [Mycena rebaudengoi]|nr:hypothetical protein C8J57DRAFT_566948 [Mycena rebaudengoi]
MSRPSAMSTSTPPYAPPAIRAITTPLVTRAAQPIPCAEALYVPLAQRVLRRRLTHKIFLYTLLYSLVHAWAWLFFHPNNTHNNFTAMSVLRWLGMGFLGWIGGVLPVLLVRKAFLTVTHTSAASPLLLLQNSFATPALRTRTLRTLQAYVLSALSVLVLHAALDASTPLFVRSRKHPWTPHPALLFLVGTQTVLAALYALRAVLRDVFVIPFSPPSRAPHPGALLAPLLLPVLALPLALLLLVLLVPMLRWLPISTAHYAPRPRARLGHLRLHHRTARARPLLVGRHIRRLVPNALPRRVLRLWHALLRLR